MTSSRYDENLASGLEHTVQEVARTDTKAGLLLTADGVLTASVTGLGALGKLSPIAVGLVVIAMVALVVATLTGLDVVRPRLAPRGVVPDKSSFVYWADAPINEVSASLQDDNRVKRLKTLSIITRRKMVALRWSAHATAVAIVALAAAAAITA